MLAQEWDVLSLSLYVSSYNLSLVTCDMNPHFRKQDSSLKISTLVVSTYQPLFIIQHFVLEGPFQNKL